MGYSKSNSKREVLRIIGIPQEKRKLSNNLIYQQKELEKKKTKPKVSKRKDIIRIRKEINKIDI